MSRLVVVSNRIATPNDKKRPAQAARRWVFLGALKASGGTWFWLEWGNR